MGKKLMVLPMKSQLEQHYNAAALKAMGVPVLKKMKRSSLDKVQEWIDRDIRMNVQYDDPTARPWRRRWLWQARETFR